MPRPQLLSCPLCAAVKGDVTRFARVFVTDQCLWFVGRASTLLIGGVKSGGVGIPDPQIPEWDRILEACC